MSFEEITPANKIKVGKERIKSRATLETTQITPPEEADIPTRELTPEELENQADELEKIREEIKKEKGVSRVGVEATVIPETPDEDFEEPKKEDEEEETEFKIIGSKRPSLEDMKIEEERFLTSFTDKLAHLAGRPKMPLKQFDEIISRDVSLADKIEILLNSLFPGMGEVGILEIGQREDLYQDIKSALAEAQGAEMHLSSKDLGKKVQEMEQRYADDSLKLFEYLKLGKVETFKDKKGREQRGIKYAKDVNIKLENYPELK